MKVHRSAIALLILLSLLLFPATPAQSAPLPVESKIDLQPGDTLTLTCPTKFVPQTLERRKMSILCRSLAQGSAAATTATAPAPAHVHPSTATPVSTASKPAKLTAAMQPGDTVTITCPTQIVPKSGDFQKAELGCRAANPTATATVASPIPATQTQASTATQPSVPAVTQTTASTATQPSMPAGTQTSGLTLTATLPSITQTAATGITQTAVTAITQTSLPTATQTLPPTATMTPFTTPTKLPGGSIQPYKGAPACTNHDPNRWHALWDYQRGCYYNHEHGDDPSLANAIFGPAGAWWNGGSGVNIGVPWATSAHENHMKHPMSKYYVRVQGGYQPFPDCGVRAHTDHSTDGSQNNCIKAVRLLAHGGSNPMEALARNHSMVIEVYITSKASNYATGGILRMGSWLDFTKLQSPFYSTQHARPGGSISFPDGSTMDFTADSAEVFRSTGGEPYWFMTLNTPETRSKVAKYPNSAGEQWSSNEVGSYNSSDCAPFPQGPECGNRHVHILIRSFDSFALLNAGNVNNPYYICSQQVPANCTYNGSTRSLKETHVWIDPAWDTLDGKKDGYVTYTGWTDRWQRMRPAGACSSIGLDCIPIMMQNVPIGFAATSHNPGPLTSDATDYDVCAKAGFWCISFPN